MKIESVESRAIVRVEGQPVLTGFENRRTPASDFLFELFEKECTDCAVDQSEAEELFDRLELLISLEFAHLRLQKMAASTNGLWFWMPIGRYIWKRHRDGAVDRLATYEDLPADHVLLQAGLLGGTSESAAKVVGEMRKFLRQNPTLTW